MANRKDSKPRNVGVQLAVDKAGGTYALAERCAVSQPTVMKWVFTSCPPARAVQIEQETGVPREVIRPDIFKK
jgi:DNA-binding transcriptional regulator YdaS (Cro superfamily)